MLRMVWDYNLNADKPLLYLIHWLLLPNNAILGFYLIIFMQPIVWASVLYINLYYADFIDKRLDYFTPWKDWECGTSGNRVVDYFIPMCSSTELEHNPVNDLWEILNSP